MTASLVNYASLMLMTLMFMILWVSLLPEQILSKAHSTASKAVSLIKYKRFFCDFVLFSNISNLEKVPENRVFKCQKVKLGMIIYSIERNCTIDYIITIYYFYELGY